MNPLVILHCDNQPQWARLIGAAQQLSAQYDVVICSTKEIEFNHGCESLWQLPIDCYLGDDQLLESLLPLCGARSHIIAGADRFGRELLPQLAARLSLPMVSEVIAVESAQRWLKAAWAGEVEQLWQGDGSSVVLSVRSANFVAAEVGECPVDVKTVALAESQQRMITNIVPHQSERPSLTQASTVIAVGRGVTEAHQWRWIEQLADELGAAIGATRPVVDGGDLPSELQIGQTGQLIAPERYIGIGISGASQHMAGIKQAKTIIAINRDADAPLCQLADYRLVGDIDEILPNLLAELPKR